MRPLAHHMSVSQMPHLPQADHFIALGLPGTLRLQEEVQ